MLTIQFYKCTAENNRLDKTDYLEEVGEPSICNPKDTLEQLNPTFTISKPLSFDIENVNYFQIKEWEMYYYFNNKSPSLEIAGRAVVTGELDHLMSYRKEILELDCVLDRQENNISSFIFDPNIKTDCRMYTQVMKFPKKLEGGSLVLTVLGG